MGTDPQQAKAYHAFIDKLQSERAEHVYPEDTAAETPEEMRQRIAKAHVELQEAHNRRNGNDPQ